MRFEIIRQVKRKQLIELWTDDDHGLIQALTIHRYKYT
jgi:hypothetical protein